jgi:hypothetical protein
MQAPPPDLERSIASVNLIMAVLCASLAYPLWAGMVPRNGMFGLRTAKSLADDPSWYAANRLLGVCLLVGASAIAALNGVYLVLGLPLPAAWHDGLLMFSTPVALVLSGGAAWLLHLRR